MRLIKYLSLILLIMILLASCSYSKGGYDLKIKISPSNKSLVDLVSRLYDESQLLDLVKFNGSIDELNDRYPIECLRENNDTYRVAYLGEESVAVLLFDNDGKKLLGNVYKIQLSKNDFSSLTKGQSLEKVREIDPNGEYLFLYTGRNDIPKVSSHYTKDGYLIAIKYDNSNNILSINEDLI